MLGKASDARAKGPVAAGVNPRGAWVITDITLPAFAASRESLQRMSYGCPLSLSTDVIIGNKQLPRWPRNSRATAGSIDRVNDVVVATLRFRGADITVRSTATLLARSCVAFAVVPVAFLFGGVKPVPHVTPRVISGGTKSV